MSNHSSKLVNAEPVYSSFLIEARGRAHKGASKKLAPVGLGATRRLATAIAWLKASAGHAKRRPSPPTRICA
jgi:hypothetical protein